MEGDHVLGWVGYYLKLDPIICDSVYLRLGWTFAHFLSQNVQLFTLSHFIL